MYDYEIELYLRSGSGIVLRHVMTKICQDCVKNDDLHCFSVKSNLYFLLNELFRDSSLACASSRGNRAYIEGGELYYAAF